jgi:hypothetical protein
MVLLWKRKAKERDPNFFLLYGLTKGASPPWCSSASFELAALAKPHHLILRLPLPSFLFCTSILQAQLRFVQLPRFRPSTMATLQVSQRIQQVRDLAKQDKAKAASSYQQILSEGPGSSEASSRDYEQALIGLAGLYRDDKRPQEIAELINTSRDTFSSFAKAKTAKLGRIQSFTLILRF